MIIDFHVHPLSWREGTASLEGFLLHFRTADELSELTLHCRTGKSFAQYLQGQGLDYAVILAENTPTTGVFDNEQVLALCRGEHALLPFGTVFPGMRHDLGGYVADLVAQGLRGLKLYPTYNLFYPNDPMLYPVYERAQELGIPVMFHTGSSVFQGSRIKYGDPLFLDDVAVDFPQLRIVLSHAGRPFWFDHAEYMARYHEHVYLDIAGLPPMHLPTYLPNLARLASKVVFGSDWPGVPGIASNLAQVRALPLDAEAIARITGENAAHILGIPHVPPDPV